MNVMDMFSLKGKVVLVVGGSGLLGTQLATALAEAGATTYITTRHEDKLDSLERTYREKGLAVSAIYADQSREETIIAARDLLLEREGRLDALVNNAVGRVMKGGWNGDTALFAASMQINATGIYALTKIFGNVMQRQRSGSIIQIASMQGMVGPDDWLYEGEFKVHPDYFFHKGGMINFTRFAASYYGKDNVRCNCISPGGIASDRTPEDFVRRYNTRTMLNRMASNTDLKGIVVFLASDASAYITGANIPVDGGYTAK
ncbi:SDR family NAD(P)-dependent oxidoreductase [Paenibacillus cymbidii]|uniref:SDR family NAD(P)-dependent oxidoreductase n=1 Tax=Paenibacillus cymbidii TaxID=1639034 RepID=UPI001081C780|nr:SDR family oxidoreductase [Paenibacillus cymbidii]